MSYFYCALEPTERKHTIANATAILTLYRGEFDAIAARGMSGMAVAPILAHHFGVPLFVVRKHGDDSHASGLVDHGLNYDGSDRNIFVGRYLIVDDFSCSGNTIKKVVKAMTEYHPKAKAVAAIFYKRPTGYELPKIVARALGIVEWPIYDDAQLST